MLSAQVQEYVSQLTDLARQLNAFAARVRAQRQESQSKPKTKTVREPTTEYVTTWPGDLPTPLFTEEDLQWLQTINT